MFSYVVVLCLLSIVGFWLLQVVLDAAQPFPHAPLEYRRDLVVCYDCFLVGFVWGERTCLDRGSLFSLGLY